MIIIKNINHAEPYKRFQEYYNNALNKNQANIEAIAISSYNSDEGLVDSRFVNLKYLINDEWVFFTNYNSPKAKQFYSNPQISALFFWSSTNIQIRIRGNIKKTSSKFSDMHFKERSLDKNALAISSSQSDHINSYEEVKKNYKISMDNIKSDEERPGFWGGFSFIPYYFEFWEGNKSRLNKREVYQKIEKVWEASIIQP
jgi:pyridoxamine 5'-phosphate oxidase